MNISPRILRAAQEQAIAQAARMISTHRKGAIESWSGLEKLFAVTVPDNFKAYPFSYGSLSTFTNWWKTSFLDRLEIEISNKDAPKRIFVDHDLTTYGNVTLYAEQEGCYKAIYQDLLAPSSKVVRAALQEGYPGAGKSHIAAHSIAHLREDGFFDSEEAQHRMHPVIIFSPKQVVETWKRILERTGLGDLVKKRKVFVFSDSLLIQEFSEMYVHWEEDMVTGDGWWEWTKMLTPLFAVIDEGHRFARDHSKRHHKMKALVTSSNVQSILWMSATFAEKVNDLKLFALSCKTRFMGIDVRDDNFNQFAGMLDATPDKPNREALKRARQVFSRNIFSIPYVKPKYQATNRVILVDFENEGDSIVYGSAHTRYIEACRKAGKNTMWGRFEKFIALNNFRKVAEPLRAWYLARQCAEDIHNGIAPVVFAAFKETITRTAFLLVDKYGIERSKLSILWGGKKQYCPQDLLTKEQLDYILLNTDMGTILEDKPLLKKIRLSLRYFQDRFEHQEDTTQQDLRHARLAELKLVGGQSDNRRQVEIDMFQGGQTVACLATLATGGIGLSLDKDKDWLWDRHGLYTPVYNGKEYRQALGRLVRRASRASARQDTVMLKGTVEEYHVAPILDEKLKSMAEFNDRVMSEVLELLQIETPVITSTGSPFHERSIEEAERDADKDETHGVIEAPEEDEEDEDNDNDEPTEII